MLQHTFIHADGIGPTTERKLWEAGAHTWDAFLDLHCEGQIRSRRLARLAPLVEESRSALRRRAIEFFSEKLPAGERWRMYADFADRAAFLDIETTGLSPDYDEVTVIGLYDGRAFHAFVRGNNLEDFPEAVARYPLIVTFNGATFDVPFLQAAFPRFKPPAHLDLRYPLRRLGLTGGLKGIEGAVGINRPSHLREVDGFEAVILWNQHRRGTPGALERLVEYCRQDTINLAPLAERVAMEMPRHVGAPSAT